MKNFHTGDKVRFISTKGSGIVTSINKNIINVMIEDGFEIPVDASDLVIIETKSGKGNPFNRKNEFSKIEKNEIPVEKPTTNQSDTEEASKQKLPEKGLYIAFIPDNQETPAAENLSVYLINYSNWQIAYNLLHSDANTGFSSISTGFMQKGDATFIENIPQNKIKKYEQIRIQFLCFDTNNHQLFESEIINFSIKTNKFVNEYIYNKNMFFDEKAYLLILKELTNPTLIKSELNFEKPQKKHSFLIDRFIVENGFAEVDLHIEKLNSNYKKMNKNEIMQTQITFFKQYLDSAIEKRLKKVVFIHGVGAGILKKEIEDILKQYSDIEYQDASILKYGIGATEVTINTK